MDTQGTSSELDPRHWCLCKNFNLIQQTLSHGPAGWRNNASKTDRCQSPNFSSLSYREITDPLNSVTAPKGTEPIWAFLHKVKFHFKPALL